MMELLKVNPEGLFPVVLLIQLGIILFMFLNIFPVISIAHFKSIISHKKYQYSTVASLARAIKLEKQDDKYCIDIYEEFGLK